MSNIIENKKAPMAEDAQLLREFLSGDQQAFTELVTKHKDRVLKTVYSFFPDINDADDIAQEVFLKVYFNAAAFKQKSSFTTWLYRITVNECYNALKHKKEKIISLEEPVSSSAATIKDTLKDDSQTIAEKILREELRKNVHRAIRSLPRKYALPVFLVDINNFTYRETADILNISIDKLKVWLYRARNHLKKKLLPIYLERGEKL